MAIERNRFSEKLIVAHASNGAHTRQQNPAPLCERKWMYPKRSLLVASLLVTACSSASGIQSQDTNAAKPTTSHAAVIVAAAVTSTATAKVGVNLAPIDYWSGSRPFVNLIYGSAFTMSSDAGGGGAEIPAESYDANGWVKSLPTGYHVNKVLSIPTASADIVCTYVGNGRINVVGPVSNIAQTAGSLTFHFNSLYPKAQWASFYYNVDPANYIRNIDCHESGLSTTSAFDSQFINALKGYQVVRFMGWMPSVVLNSGNEAAFPAATITMANRNQRGGGDYTARDGVPVEVMVDLANEADVDPWFSIPWNADDAYITNFAMYVRDHLNSTHKVYVENSNEVWNWGYHVTHQAANEGAAENLPSSDGGVGQQGLERYAEKTEHVMKIWSDVFAGQNSRLVRIAAFQHYQPYWADKILAYNNFASSVDAVATAPYWGITTADYTGQSLDQIMNTFLPGQITTVLSLAAQQKQIAAKYGKRYIAYEGGQSVELPNNLSLLEQIEHDTRMYDLYKTFINGWNTQAGGDSLVLTNLQGPISTSGAWGLAEYIGQPISLSTTPKLHAVREFLGLSTTTASLTATYQTCPDGSVILSTINCPTTSSGVRASPGLRKGHIRQL